MQVTFLGTGTSQGVPIIGCDCDVCLSTNKKDKRLRCSIFLKWDDFSLVIDSGPDFRYQLLREEINDIDAVLYTHEHKDHVAGLDDIRPINYLQNKSIDIYGSHLVETALKREFHYIFADTKYPGAPRINFNLITNNAFQLGPINVLPIEGLHYRLPVFGYRIKDFCYITDMNFISEEEKSKMKDLDVLVINGLRREKHISHFTLEEALEMIAELKPKQAYITHMSHQLGTHEEVSKELPENVHLSYDGLKINL
jgi:phosphoribosyl 1,2-cyclic phosphate phosphodiesterase